MIEMSMKHKYSVIQYSSNSDVQGKGLNKQKKKQEKKSEVCLKNTYFKCNSSCLDNEIIYGHFDLL